MPKRTNYHSMFDLKAATETDVSFRPLPGGADENQYLSISRYLWNDLGGPRRIVVSIQVPSEPQGGW